MTDRSRDAGATLDLLGLVGCVSLASVEWLGGCLATAPTLRASVGATRLIGEGAARLNQVTERIVHLGADDLDVLGRFDGLFDDFEARTPARSWWEGLVKVYIAEGVLRDFCVILAAGVGGDDAALVGQVLGASPGTDGLAERVAEAAASDPVLASRLALWGRRLVGEALGVVQGLIDRPQIASLLAAAPDGERGQASVFSQLTADHTRRMGRLSLAA